MSQLQDVRNKNTDTHTESAALICFFLKKIIIIITLLLWVDECLSWSIHARDAPMATTAALLQYALEFSVVVNVEIIFNSHKRNENIYMYIYYAYAVWQRARWRQALTWRAPNPMQDEPSSSECLIWDRFFNKIVIYIYISFKQITDKKTNKT